MKRILNLVGENLNHLIEDEFPGAVVHAEPDGGKYDIIYSLYELAQRSITEARDRLIELSDMLNVEGQIHLTEPSAEWFARKVTTDGVTDEVSLLGIYGTDNYHFKSLYTMNTLRMLLDLADLYALVAKHESFVIATTANNNSILWRRHRIVAVRISESGKSLWKD